MSGKRPIAQAWCAIIPAIEVNRREEWFMITLAMEKGLFWNTVTPTVFSIYFAEQHLLIIFHALH